MISIVIVFLSGWYAAPSLPGVAPQVRVPVTVELKASCAINSNKIKLSDISQCSGYREICEEGYGIDIGDSPEPGRIAILTVKQIAAVMTKEWPNADIRFIGAPSVTVHSESGRIAIEVVKQAIVDWLKVNVSGDGRVILGHIAFSSPPKIRGGEFSLEIEPPWFLATGENEVDLWAKMAKTKSVTLRHVAKATGEQTEFRVSVTFMVTRSVLVAIRSLKPGVELQDGDVRSISQSLAMGLNDYVLTTQDVAGLTTAVGISAGQTLRRSQFVSPLLVKKGELVRLTLRHGLIELAGQVQALDNGRVGDRISVQYVKAKKIVQAKVDGQQSVVIESPE